MHASAINKGAVQGSAVLAIMAIPCMYMFSPFPSASLSLSLVRLQTLNVPRWVIYKR
jgi:hypothetical protein